MALRAERGGRIHALLALVRQRVRSLARCSRSKALTVLLHPRDDSVRLVAHTLTDKRADAKSQGQARDEREIQLGGGESCDYRYR